MKKLSIITIIIFILFSCSVYQNNQTDSFKITYPDSGELWKTGGQYVVKWDNSGTTDDFNIDLYLDDKYISTLSSNVRNKDNCVIEIPSDLTENYYRIKLTKTTSGQVAVYSESEKIKIVNKFNWLIMFYGSADNNLEQYIYNDLNEIEASDKTTKSIKSVALIDRTYNYTTVDGNWSETRAYDIGYDNNGFNKELTESSVRLSISDLSVDVSGSTELNMGDKKTLSTFIEYCYSNYPADKYMLVIASHGSGFRNDDLQSNNFSENEKSNAVSYDDSDEESSLNMKELRDALTEGLNGKKLDIITFDACNMGMIEVAYEIKDLSSIMISSSYTIPTYGLPYYNIFERLNSTTDELSPQVVSSIIVDEFYNGYTKKNIIENKYYSTENIALSAIDLRKINKLSYAVNDLAGEIIKNNNCGDERFETLTYSYKEYADIGDFALKTIDLYPSSRLIKSAIEECVINCKSGNNFIGATGLSIFFPVHGNYIYDSLVLKDYNENELLFAKDNPSWVTLINSSSILTGTDKDEYTKGEKNGISGYGNNTGFDSFYNDKNKLIENSVIQSLISYSDDEDWYYIDENTHINLKLTSPSSASYKIFLYIVYSVTDSKIEILPVSSGYDNIGNLSIENEEIDYNYGYIVKITGNGSYSKTDSYSLSYQKVE